MKTNPKDLDRPAVHSLVSAYLMARAYAETMRASVDMIHGQILAECPIMEDKRDGAPITASKDLYLSSDDAACADFYAEANKRLRAANLKPADMPDEHCPALVAEHLLTRIERELIDESGKAFDVTADKLICAPRGLENWKKWIDLVCSFIVPLPHFKAPKIAA